MAQEQEDSGTNQKVRSKKQDARRIRIKNQEPGTRNQEAEAEQEAEPKAESRKQDRTKISIRNTAERSAENC
jgi:hypothetical protein